MKSHLIRLVLPIMVFASALLFAFASVPNSSIKKDLITGYIFKDNVCVESRKECNNLVGPLCVQDGSDQVYMNRLNNTSCEIELTHWE